MAPILETVPPEIIESANGMTIQLNPEDERLIAQASELATEQWMHEFEAWVDSHFTTTPPLSDEAISRESIYRARGL